MSNKSMSTSPAADPFAELLDFSEYDKYQSPSLSPATTKTPFTRPAPVSATTAALMPTTQTMSGPSHQYDQYKQQTGMVPGALANTFAVNQNAQIAGYQPFNAMDYLGISNDTADDFDFNTLSQASISGIDIDMDFDSPDAENTFLFDATVNPTALSGQGSPTLPSPSVVSTTSNVGRVWPGMHQQAALAKAQAQQRQQQQIIQQQQQRQNVQGQQKTRPKGAQPTDPLVEQKITQLLNSMRAKPASQDSAQDSPQLNIPRPRKDEEDMDEDERLLASEEGKKLTSKERRQLRNKVSARAFRSRRKEYITQLEAEIATKVTENNDLRSHNRALVDENKRLSDLTRMLLSSPSFSNFLDQLSSNPSMLPPTQPAPAEVKQESRQPPKDINPYAAQQINMSIIPEQTVDFSMLNLDGDSTFSYQPQVFAVLETPEIPVLDMSVLSGKTSNFVGTYEAEDEKVDMPIIDRPAEKKVEVEEITAPLPVDEDFENDPAFALYHDAPPTQAVEVPAEIDTEALSEVDIFGGIEPEKAFARVELVDASDEEVTRHNNAIVLARTERIIANLEAITSRLDDLCLGS